VAYCADAAATSDLMMASGIHVLMGNCEENLAAGSADCGCGFEEGTACDLLSRGWYAHAAREIRAAHRAWMGTRPRRIDIVLPDGRRLAVVHGGATDISRFLFASTPDAVLHGELAATGRDGVVGGHSGIPFARRVGPDGLWLNAGAIGMPANDGTPRGWFMVLTPDAEELVVEALPLSYDYHAAVAAMRASGLVDVYADALCSGLWPSCDVLPDAERGRRGKPIAPFTMAW
jgi:hypothetical protein